jgi:hypothetical protein
MSPKVEDITIEDIARGLSTKVRFNGQVRLVYTIAQHSLMVSTMLWEKTHDSRLAYAGLLHDAHEAYGPDVSKPIKHLRNVGDILVSERLIDKAIEEKFTIDLGHPMIKVIDNTALAVECPQVSCFEIKETEFGASLEMDDDLVEKYRNVVLMEIPWRYVEQTFLSRFEALRCMIIRRFDG